MDLPAYLERISYPGPTAANEATLCALHRAHMQSVPFENLDIRLGRKIACEQESFIRKIVDQRRGGFCYELNGAFAALLTALGFKVTLLSARVPREDGTEGPEFDHVALRIDLEEPWLADVGFGDSFPEPLRLQIGLEQSQERRKFRIVEGNGSLHMEMEERGRDWKRQYSFSLTPRQLGDFAAMCNYHQTSPESPFTRGDVCSMATPGGRVTVADRKLIVTQAGERTETTLDTEEQWKDALRTHFGVRL